MSSYSVSTGVIRCILSIGNVKLTITENKNKKTANIRTSSRSFWIDYPAEERVLKTSNLLSENVQTALTKNEKSITIW